MMKENVIDLKEDFKKNLWSNFCQWVWRIKYIDRFSNLYKEPGVVKMVKTAELN
jgi:hypothetical protein